VDVNQTMMGSRYQPSWFHFCSDILQICPVILYNWYNGFSFGLDACVMGLSWSNQARSCPYAKNQLLAHHFAKKKSIAIITMINHQ
jgi:hypothetical protein